MPTRGAKNKKIKNDDADEPEINEKVENNDQNINDLIPRVDISSQITESLLSELSDKNWKVNLRLYSLDYDN